MNNVQIKIYNEDVFLNVSSNSFVEVRKHRGVNPFDKISIGRTFQFDVDGGYDLDELFNRFYDSRYYNGFNPKLGIDAELLVDGMLIDSGGQLFLKRVEKSDSQTTYSCIYINALGRLMDWAKKTYLNELPTCFEMQWNYESAKSAIEMPLADTSKYMPIINYGKMGRVDQFFQLQGNQVVNNVDWEDLRPALRLSVIYSNINSQAILQTGKTFSISHPNDDIIYVQAANVNPNTNDFETIYHVFDNKIINGVETTGDWTTVGNTYAEIRTKFESAIITYNKYIFDYRNDPYNTSYDMTEVNTGYSYTFANSGLFNLSFNFNELYYEVIGDDVFPVPTGVIYNNFFYLGISVYVNDVFVKRTICGNWIYSNGTSRFIVNGNQAIADVYINVLHINLYVHGGDVVTFKYCVLGSPAYSDTLRNARLKINKAAIIIKKTEDRPIAYGQTIDFKDFMPKVTIADFIETVANMFNLGIKGNIMLPIEPYISNPIDLSGKYDPYETKEVNVNDYDYGYVDFNFKDSNDIFGEDYKKRTGKGYLNGEIEMASTSKDRTSLEVKATAFPVINTSSGLIITNRCNSNNEPIENELAFGIRSDSGTGILVQGRKNMDDQNESSEIVIVPHFGHFGSIGGTYPYNIFDLSFERPDLLYATLFGGSKIQYTDWNLYTRFWYQTLGQFNSPRYRPYEITLYFDLHELISFDIFNLYLINGIAHRILEIQIDWKNIKGGQKATVVEYIDVPVFVPNIYTLNNGRVSNIINPTTPPPIDPD